MIKIKYDNDIRQEAMTHAQHMCRTSFGQNRRFFSYKGQCANNDETAFLGKIAEILVRNWFLNNELRLDKSPLDEEAYERPETNYNSDYEINGYTIELKTKTINCEPQGHYDVGTTRISLAQIYMFSRVWDEASVLYLCGWIPTDEFKAKSIFRPKGSFVKNSSESEFTCLSDEYLLSINELKQPLELICLLK
jgi:hypothetical protein